MAYRLAVLAYLLMVAGLIVLLLVLGIMERHALRFEPLQFIVNFVWALPSTALYLVPLGLVLYRWRWWRKDHAPLLPEAYRRERLLGYRAGAFFAWLGHLLLLCSLLLVARMLLSQIEPLPAGLGIGVAMQCYLVSMYCVELSMLGWTRRGAVQGAGQLRRGIDS